MKLLTREELIEAWRNWTLSEISDYIQDLQEEFAQLALRLEKAERKVMAKTDQANQVEIARDTFLQRGQDGFWLMVPNALLNIGLLGGGSGVIHKAFMRWARSFFCAQCDGLGCIDTPTSADDPSCPECAGDGAAQPEQAEQAEQADE